MTRSSPQRAVCCKRHYHQRVLSVLTPSIVSLLHFLTHDPHPNACIMMAAGDGQRVVLCATADEREQAVCDAGNHHAEEACVRKAPVKAGTKPPVGGSRCLSRARGVCILTAPEVITIFEARMERSGIRDQVASRLAFKFGVSPRTVRDIWNLRTWAETTRALWSPSEVAREANNKTRRRTPEAQEPHEPRGDDAREANNHKCCRMPPEAQASHAAHGKWKLCAAWLVPGEELKRDEFDSVLDHILASAGPSDILL